LGGGGSVERTGWKRGGKKKKKGKGSIWNAPCQQRPKQVEIGMELKKKPRGDKKKVGPKGDLGRVPSPKRLRPLKK